MPRALCAHSMRTTKRSEQGSLGRFGEERVLPGGSSKETKASIANKRVRVTMLTHFSSILVAIGRNATRLEGI